MKVVKWMSGCVLLPTILYHPCKEYNGPHYKTVELIWLHTIIIIYAKQRV